MVIWVTFKAGLRFAQPLCRVHSSGLSPYCLRAKQLVEQLAEQLLVKYFAESCH